MSLCYCLSTGNQRTSLRHGPACGRQLLAGSRIALHVCGRGCCSEVLSCSQKSDRSLGSKASRPRQVKAGQGRYLRTACLLPAHPSRHIALPPSSLPIKCRVPSTVASTVPCILPCIPSSYIPRSFLSLCTLHTYCFCAFLYPKIFPSQPILGERYSPVHQLTHRPSLQLHNRLAVSSRCIFTPPLIFTKPPPFLSPHEALR